MRFTCTCGHVLAEHDRPRAMVSPFMPVPPKRCLHAGCGCQEYEERDSAS